jgi:serine/threonine-protein kinase
MDTRMTMPSKLGLYRLGEMLGDNGLMVTRRATLEGAGSPAVVLGIETGYVKGDVRETFAKKAEELSTRQTPLKRILPPLQWGEEAGWLWSASEHVAGDHTGRLMASSGLPPAHITVDVARQVAEALEELGESGLCHGTLSPASVQVDEEGEVRVLHVPWGHLIQGIEDRYLHPAMMSVLAFAAPEVAKSETPTMQGDAYSLGVLVYFLLMGRPPYWAETPKDLMQAMAAKPVNLDPVKSRVPESVTELLEELLSLDPEDRPVNWPAVAQRLASAAPELAKMEEELEAEERTRPPESAGTEDTVAEETVTEEPETVVVGRPTQAEPDEVTAVHPPPGRKELPAEDEKTAVEAPESEEGPIPESDRPKPAAAYRRVAPPVDRTTGMPKPSGAYRKTKAPGERTSATGAAPAAAERVEKSPSGGESRATKSLSKTPDMAKPDSAGEPTEGLATSTGAGPRTVALLLAVGLAVVLVAGGGYYLLAKRSEVRGEGPTTAVTGPTAPVEKDPAYTATANTILTLGRLVQLYERTNGRYPETLADLPLVDTPVEDAWGTPLDLREGFVISAGEDKAWDTADDFYFDPEYTVIGGYVDKIDLEAKFLASGTAEEAPEEK